MHAVRAPAEPNFAQRKFRARREFARAAVEVEDSAEIIAVPPVAKIDIRNSARACIDAYRGGADET